MKRNVLFAFGLLLMVASASFFGAAWWAGKVTDSLTHLLAGVFGVGAVLSALMADPKALLGLIDRGIAFRSGKKSEGS